MNVCQVKVVTKPTAENRLASPRMTIVNGQKKQFFRQLLFGRQDTSYRSTR